MGVGLLVLIRGEEEDDDHHVVVERKKRSRKKRTNDEDDGRPDGGGGFGLPFLFFLTYALSPRRVCEIKREKWKSGPVGP